MIPLPAPFIGQHLSPSRLLGKLWGFLGLLGAMLLSLGPFLWLLSTSFKGAGDDLFTVPVQWWPSHLTLANYVAVWQKIPFLSYFLNSLVVTSFTVVLNLTLSTLAAYALTCFDFWSRRAWLMLILLTMLIPFQVVMLPLFLLVMRLGLTYETGGWLAGNLGLALPFAVSGFGIFFVREAMKSLPPDMLEASVLDGANALQRLWYVVIPLIKPTLATLAIFTLLASWGEFLWPSIVLNRQEQFTLPLGLVQLQGQFGSDWRLIAAGTLLSMVPVLLVFVVLQRLFLQSNATDAGVKG